MLVAGLNQSLPISGNCAFAGILPPSSKLEQLVIQLD